MLIYFKITFCQTITFLETNKVNITTNNKICNCLFIYYIVHLTTEIYVHCTVFLDIINILPRPILMTQLTYKKCKVPNNNKSLGQGFKYTSNIISIVLITNNVYNKYSSGVMQNVSINNNKISVQLDVRVMVTFYFITKTKKNKKSSNYQL